ncbi:hypothetical protein KKG46_00785 [Patescibacteria group bacterium]|nr:hypothetical protein [Patescibacteria group bacterium]
MRIQLTADQMVRTFFDQMLEQEFEYRSKGHAVEFFCDDEALFRSLAVHVQGLLRESCGTCRPSMNVSNRWMTAIKARIRVFELKIQPPNRLHVTLVE